MISLNGFNNQVVTFEATNLDAGLVKMDSSNKVKNVVSGDDFIGVAISVREGNADVVMEGYVEVKYSGTAPTVGFHNILASSKSAVEVNDSKTSAKKRLVTKVDTANSIVGFIL